MIKGQAKPKAKAKTQREGIASARRFHEFRASYVATYAYAGTSEGSGFRKVLSAPGSKVLIASGRLKSSLMLCQFWKNLEVSRGMLATILSG